MNKNLVKVSFLLCIALFSSCGNGLLGKNDSASEQYANLSISMNDTSVASGS